MTVLALLIVTAMGYGPPSPPGTKPNIKVVPNSTVTVSRDTKTGLKVVGSLTEGELKLRVRPGVYKLEAVLRGTTFQPSCEPKTIRIKRVKRGERPRRVGLACNTM